MAKVTVDLDNNWTFEVDIEDKRVYGIYHEGIEIGELLKEKVFADIANEALIADEEKRIEYINQRDDDIARAENQRL